MTPFCDLDPTYQEELMDCSSRDEIAAVAEFVNTRCPDDTPGFPLWMRDTIHLMKSKPLSCKTLKAIPKL